MGASGQWDVQPEFVQSRGRLFSRRQQRAAQIRGIYIYDLPVGKGKHFGSDWSRPMDAVLGGWAWTGILTAESGLPFPSNRRRTTSVSGFNQRPNVVPGVNPIPTNQ